MRNGLVTVFGLLALASCATATEKPAPGAASSSSAPVQMHILAINDFHGNLEPPSGGARSFNPAEQARIPAGGAPRLAASRGTR